MISICIPAYKRIEYLVRLLDSIHLQDYRDFEVIVTDDSPDDSVEQICKRYTNKFRLLYFKNKTTLGTPENWNEGVRRANGDWIKIMHDDDFFIAYNSLRSFAEQTKNNDCDFVFSSFYNVVEDTNRRSLIKLSALRNFYLKNDPVTLISKNCIGPPSVTLYRKKKLFNYDNRMKWLVDLDFYIQYLKHATFNYIDKPLIGIGVHAHQVTNVSSLNPSVEIPEHLLLLEKCGLTSMRNLLFFDAYWRLLRNLNIYDLTIFSAHAKGYKVPDVVISMLKFQHAIPRYFIQFGVTSKLIMTGIYLVYRLRAKI